MAKKRSGLRGIVDGTTYNDAADPRVVDIAVERAEGA